MSDTKQVTVTISGPPGSGKSLLADAMLEWLTKQPGVFVKANFWNRGSQDALKRFSKVGSPIHIVDGSDAVPF